MTQLSHLRSRTLTPNLPIWNPRSNLIRQLYSVIFFLQVQVSTTTPRLCLRVDSMLNLI